MLPCGARCHALWWSMGQHVTLRSYTPYIIHMWCSCTAPLFKFILMNCNHNSWVTVLQHPPIFLPHCCSPTCGGMIFHVCRPLSHVVPNSGFGLPSYSWSIPSGIWRHWDSRLQLWQLMRAYPAVSQAISLWTTQPWSTRLFSTERLHFCWPVLWWACLSDLLLV